MSLDWEAFLNRAEREQLKAPGSTVTFKVVPGNHTYRDGQDPRDVLPAPSLFDMQGSINQMHARRVKEIQKMALLDTLLLYSEWLDYEGLMADVDDDKSHEELAREFLSRR